MTISKRHHYIPRFLIDNFTDSDNKVWVYNKEENSIIKIKQSSKSIFFELNRNSFNLNGSISDNVEQLYSEVDNLLARNLKNVLANNSMTGRELTLLILLVTLIKWRIPSSDEIFHTKFKDIPIEQLGIAIKSVINNSGRENDDVKEIADMDIVKEMKRILLSIQPLIREETLKEIHENCFIVSNNKFPSLLGDVPVIENPNLSYETLEDFIFPLSSNETLVCKREAEKYISNDFFYIQRNLTTFHLSKKYVVCESKDQLLKTSELYSILLKENKTHLLTKTVFEFIK